MDMNMEIFWHEIDFQFQDRLALFMTTAYAFDKKETKMRIEEILDLRDRMKALWDSKIAIRTA